MNSSKIRVAQLRGNGLSDRETKTWKYFSDDFIQTVFATKSNLFKISPLPFSIVTLRSSGDNFFQRIFINIFLGNIRECLDWKKN